MMPVDWWRHDTICTARIQQRVHLIISQVALRARHGRPPERIGRFHVHSAPYVGQGRLQV